MLAMRTRNDSESLHMTDTAPFRDQSLDFMRGVAILMVILLHVGALTPGMDQYEYAGLAFARLGGGVQLFFVLSGLLIARSWNRSMVAGEGISGYAIRRAAKILPLYYLVLAINISIFLLERNHAAGQIEIRNSINAANLTSSNISIHVLFLQGFFPSKLHTLVDGSWSIVCEVYFYILAPLLFRFVRNLYGALCLFAISLFVSVVFVIVEGRYFSGFSFYAFPSQFPCFVLGIICHYVWDDDMLIRKIQGAAIPIAFAAAIIFGSALRLGTKPLPESVLPGLCSAALVLTAPRLWALSHAFLRSGLAAIGRQSYSIFFIHTILLKLAVTYMTLSGWPNSFEGAFLFNLVVGLFGSLFFSAILLDPIDRTCVARINRWLRRRSDRNGELN